MQHYKVQLQDQFGQVIEEDYHVRWNPEKVDSSEVALACAAERTYASGKLPDGNFRNKFAGISAVHQG